VRLQPHALAYNLANFLRSLALPNEVEHWSLTSLREKLVKIVARIVRHGRYVVFQLTEVAVPRALLPASCVGSTARGATRGGLTIVNHGASGAWGKPCAKDLQAPPTIPEQFPGSAPHCSRCPLSRL